MRGKLSRRELALARRDYLQAKQSCVLIQVRRASLHLFLLVVLLLLVLVTPAVQHMVPFRGTLTYPCPPLPCLANLHSPQILPSSLPADSCFPPTRTHIEQSAIRGKLSRREFALARKAATKLQALVRMRKAKREYLQAKSSCVLIQAGFRGALARGGLAAQVQL